MYPRQYRTCASSVSIAEPEAVAAVGCMAIQRMEHVGIAVDDLAAATGFFVEFGLLRCVHKPNCSL